MEIIEQIGAYAGLAAVVGLAVLSALYFSQARDVKRLREWAGRAPERAVPGAQAPAVPQRVVAQPQPKPATSTPATPSPAGQQAVPAQGATPAQGGPPKAPPEGAPVPVPAKPVPAMAAAGARQDIATAATAERQGGPGAATPAAQSKQDADAKPAGAEANSGGEPAAPATAAQAGSAVPATRPPEAAPGAAPAEPAREPATGAKPAAPAPAPGPLAAATPAAQARPVPPAPSASPPGQPLPAATAKPVPPARSALPARPALERTAIIPPAGSGGAIRAGGLPRSRIVALAVAGVLVVGGGVAFAVSQLTGDEETGGGSERQLGEEGSDRGGRSAPAVDPANVKVAVLNGTLVPGLAAALSDKAEQLGFDVGVEGNADDQEQQRAESVVLYAKGHRREAVVVSRRLRIPQREAIDPNTQALAGDAGVVVIAGADQTP